MCQFQAMRLFAFYAFLRVDEITSTNGLGPQALKMRQVV